MITYPNPLKALLNVVAVVIATGVALKARTWLVNAQMQPMLATGVSLACAAFIHQLLQFLLTKAPKVIPLFRWIIDPITRIEGFWFEEVDAEENPFSYACLEYNPATSEFRYYGSNYTPDFRLNATFESTWIASERALNGCRFNFKADVFGSGKTENRISGYGHLWFRSDRKIWFSRGEGSFIDTGSLLKERRLVLIRMRKSFIKEELGHSKPEDEHEIARLVKAFHEKKNQGSRVFGLSSAAEHRNRAARIEMTENVDISRPQNL